MRAPITIALVLAIVAVGVLPAPAAPLTVRELTRPEGFTTRVFDLNDAGEAVGYVLDDDLLWRAIHWDADGVPTFLEPAGTWSMAIGISPSGTISGFYGPTVQSTEPVVWDDGRRTALAHLPGAGSGEAVDLNDAGLVVGYDFDFGLGDPVATAWRGERVARLAAPFSSAHAVNRRGQIVGHAEISGFFRAALWQEGRLELLPGLGGDNDTALGIDDAGTIVGAAFHPDTSKFHAVVWPAETHEVVDLGLYLGTFNTTAEAVGPAGVIVGSYVIEPVSGETRALLWRDGAARDLNELIPPDSGWVLHDAVAINARGWIVGWGVRSGRTGERAFLLEPSQP